ncbi:MAG: 50S ribosomal protein L16 [Methanobacteriota archaeon]|nr:MAG: 50S ribosomal protein L16 [Euryarchaeota archaeon]
MGKRPARCYSYSKGPAYTRTQGRKNKGYIRGIPGSKLQIYDMGKKGGDFNAEVHMIGLEACNIRHMALEAARQAINRKLMKKVGRDNYHFRVRKHPHHVLRENKMMAFAGADRMQDGMRKSFGKPTDRAARIKANDELFTIRVNKENLPHAIAAMQSGVSKMPCPARVVVGKVEEE